MCSSDLDGDHEIADLEPVGIAQIEAGQRLGPHPQDGDVGIGVGADQMGDQLAPVAQGDDDLLGAGDDVIVGQIGRASWRERV